MDNTTPKSGDRVQTTTIIRHEDCFFIPCTGIIIQHIGNLYRIKTDKPQKNKWSEDKDELIAFEGQLKLITHEEKTT